MVESSGGSSGETPVGVGEVPLGVPVGLPVGGVAVHLLQMVDVDVRVTVDTVLYTEVVVTPPEVAVVVTGQVVRVSHVTTVVVESGGMEEDPPWLVGWTPDEVPAVPVGAGLLGEGTSEEPPTGELPVGFPGVPVGFPGVSVGFTEVSVGFAGVSVEVTGQTVVETAMVEVTTVVESPGQLVTVGAQLVMVIRLVVYTVEVVILTGVLGAGGVTALEDDGTGITGVEECPVAVGLVW